MNTRASAPPVVRARDLAGDAGTRQQIDHLLESLDRDFANVQQAFPKAVEHLQRQLNEATEGAKKTQGDLAKMEAELARHEAAAAASAARAPVPAVAAAAIPALPIMLPLDLAGGLRVRDDLLRLFGAAPPSAGPDLEGSVAAMDEGEWSEQKSAQGQPAPKPPVADEWPKELRTPSTKKRPDDPGARPHPGPMTRASAIPGTTRTIGRTERHQICVRPV